jgi:hypothetical protein
VTDANLTDSLNAYWDTTTAKTKFAVLSGDAWTGVHDFGAATSLEIPNGTNPTIDLDGEIAWDSDDHMLKVYDSTQDAAIGISALGDASFSIPNPSVINDTIDIFYVSETKYPFGIKIVSIELLRNDSLGTTYAATFEEFTGKKTVSQTAWIDTLTIAADSTYTKSILFTDADIAAGNRIRIGLPTTDVANISGVITFYAKTGD